MILKSKKRLSLYTNRSKMMRSKKKKKQLKVLMNRLHHRMKIKLNKKRTKLKRIQKISSSRKP